MIQNEKDRLDCLKLAVSLFIPKNQMKPDEVSKHVIDAATAFVQFVENPSPASTEDKG